MCIIVFVVKILPFVGNKVTGCSIYRVSPRERVNNHGRG